LSHQDAAQSRGQSLITVTVEPGNTLSGIAAQYGTTYQALAAENHIANPNLIYAGQQLDVDGGGNSVQGGGVQSNYTPPQSPASTSYTPTPVASGGGALDDVPGVPAGFAACVAQRESSDGANQAYNGGVYGIITASGIDVNGQSLAAQKQAFSELYAADGTAPWAPSDGC
jgi:hypothetical protein